MNFSDGEQDMIQPEHHDPEHRDTGADPRAPRSQEGVQDILDLIDQLAQVTQQLQAPHHGVDHEAGHGPEHQPEHQPDVEPGLAGQPPQQPLAVSGAEG